MHDYPMGASTDTVMACLPAGEMVTTRRGLVPIEQVLEGDLVLTHRSRWKRVTGTTVRRHDGQLVTVTPFGLMPVRMTEEHPVWSAGSRFDSLGPRGSATNRLLPSVWSFIEARHLKVGPLKSGSFIFAPLPTDEYLCPSFDLAEYVGVPKAHGIGWHVSEDTLRWKKRMMPRRLVVDEEVALLLGLYIAEGSVGRHGTQISFGLNKKETHLRDFIVDVARSRLNSQVSVVTATGHGGMAILIQSSVFARLLVALGARENKHIPWDWWWKWPTATRLALVRGWLMGDGHIARAGKAHLSAVSIAQSWLYQAQLALWESGLVSSLGVFKQPEIFRGKPCGHRPAWRLTLSSSDTAKLLAAPTEVERKHWGAHGCIALSRTCSKSLPVAGGAALRLRKIGREDFAGMVYNLHVEEDESFVVGGIAVHNCHFCREAISKWGTGSTMGVGGTGGLQGLNDR